MKNFILSLLLLFVCFIAEFSPLYSQEKDVTKFLGIPVDGFKPDMIKKLEEKGFVYNEYSDCLAGEFNGQNVEIQIGTNNNKVYRIALADRRPHSETDIKIRFNNLCQQFEKNKKYRSLTDPETQCIPQSTNISYEMTVNKKRFQACYFQLSGMSLESSTQDAFRHFQTIYTGLTRDNVTEAIQKEINEYAVDHIMKKMVWFMIVEDGARYNLFMYYDNEYNHADGEDL